MMAILALRIDVPDADPDSTDPVEVADPILNRFNDWLRAMGREGQQVGLGTREGTWETE